MIRIIYVISKSGLCSRR